MVLSPSQTDVFVVGSLEQVVTRFSLDNDGFQYIDHRPALGAKGLALTHNGRYLMVASSVESAIIPVFANEPWGNAAPVPAVGEDAACALDECTVYGRQGAYRVSIANGTILQVLEGDFRGGVYSPDGRDLYLSERSSNRLVLVKTGAGDTTSLDPIAITVPDALAISSDGSFLLAAGFCDHDVGLYARNAIDGRLSFIASAFSNRPKPAGCYAQDLPDEDQPRVIRPTSLAIDDSGYVLVSGGSVTAPELAWLRLADGQLDVVSFVDDELEPHLLGTLEFVSTREGQAVPEDSALLEVGSDVDLVDGKAVATLWSAESLVSLQMEANVQLDHVIRAGEHGVDGISAAHELAITHDGLFAYVAPRSQNRIGAFRIQPASGELVPLPATILPIEGDFFGAIGTLDLVANDRELLAADVANPVLHVLRRDTKTGSLSHQRAYQVPDCQGEEVLMVAVRATQDGTRVYASNFQRQGSSCLLRWNRDPITGELEYLAPMTDPFLSGVEGIELSPDDNHLYTANYLSQSVGHYRRDGGELVPQTPFEHPDLYGAEFMQIAPDGEAIWVSVPAHPESSRIVVLRRSPGTGDLSYLQTITTATGAALDGVGGLAVSPDGEVLVAAAHHADAINTFIVAESGQLTLSHVTAASNRLRWVHDVQFENTGAYVYSVSLQASSITQWALHTGDSDGCGSACNYSAR